MEFLRETGSKTVLLTILVSLVIIETSSNHPYEEQIKKRVDIPVIFFSSKSIGTNALSVFNGRSIPKNSILTQNWFKDSILDNIGVSSGD